jgi:hypothetical protein
VGDGLAVGVGDGAGLVAGVAGVIEGLGVAERGADGDAGLRGLGVGVGESAGNVGAGRDAFWPAGSPAWRASGAAGPGGRTSRYRASVSRKNPQRATVERRIRSRVTAPPSAGRCPGRREREYPPATARR